MKYLFSWNLKDLPCCLSTVSLRRIAWIGIDQLSNTTQLSRIRKLNEVLLKSLLKLRQLLKPSKSIRNVLTALAGGPGQ